MTTISTPEELAALPAGTSVRDAVGDVGTITANGVLYPETALQTFERASRKYAPFVVLDGAVKEAKRELLDLIDRDYQMPEGVKAKFRAHVHALAAETPAPTQTDDAEQLRATIRAIDEVVIDWGAGTVHRPRSPYYARLWSILHPPAGATVTADRQGGDDV